MLKIVLFLLFVGLLAYIDWKLTSWAERRANESR